MKHSGSEGIYVQPGVDELPPSLEVLTIADAALRCGTSDDTLRRRLAQGEFKGAFQDSSRRNAWFIPAVDLHKAGFSVKDPKPTNREGWEDEVSQRDALLAAAAAALELSETRLGAAMQRVEQATEEVQHLRRWLDQVLGERQMILRSA
ncbi:MAG: hypothetical protein ACYC5Z_09310 [Acidimicrobiales bacterium]